MRLLIAICLIVFAFAKAESSTLQNYKQHVVQSGDTVETIAKKYSTTTTELIKLNPDIKSGLRLGAIILLPAGSDGLTQAQIKDYKKHRVRRRETLYSLAKKYGVTELDIKEANKELYSKSLRKGDRIRIPVFYEVAIIDDENTNSNKPLNTDTIIEVPDGKYLVKAKETMYGISKSFGLTVSQLKELNPDIKALQPGMLINVPVMDAMLPNDSKESNAFVDYIVPSKMTMYSLERITGISEDSLITLNPNLRDGLKAGMLLKVPNLNRNGNLAAVEKNVNSARLVDSISNFQKQRIAVMLPFSMHKVNEDVDEAELLKKDKTLRIALDFYSGMIVARDSARKLGIDVQYDLFDTQKSTKHLTSILSSNDFSNYQSVIGPLVSKNVELMAKELKSDDIPVISPLTNTDVRLYKNLFQARPDNAILKERLYAYLRANAEGKNIIIVNDAKKPELKNEVLAMFPNATVLKTNKDNYIYKNTYLAALDNEKENWVILAVDNEGFITDAVSHYSSKAESHKVTMFGYDNFEKFELPNSRLASLKFTYPSMNFPHGVRNAFTRSYYERFNITPNDYATRGFDVAMDVILRQASSSGMYESVMKNGQTRMVENKFNYSKKFMAGYYNEAVYILQYQEDLSIKELE